MPRPLTTQVYFAVVSLRIRLSRVGAKKQASYRIVVAETAAPRDGKAIAILGHYNPLTDPYTLKVDEERTVRWLRNGAQPSETARGLLAKAGVMAAYESARASAAAKPKKAKGEAAEETKARRAARAKRTEPPRLVRPVKTGESAAASAKPAHVAATKKAAAAKPAAKAKATAKTAAAKKATATKAAAKPATKAAAKPAAGRSKAGAAKES